MLRPRAVASVSNIEGGLAATVALLVTGNARPSDDDGVGARGERGPGVSIRGKERGKEVTTVLRIRGRINGPYSKTVWAESQLRFKVWHCHMVGTALPHSPK